MLDRLVGVEGVVDEWMGLFLGELDGGGLGVRRVVFLRVFRDRW